MRCVPPGSTRTLWEGGVFQLLGLQSGSPQKPMVTGPPWDASSPKKWGESQRAAHDGGVKVFVTWSAQGTLRSLGGGHCIFPLSGTVVSSSPWHLCFPCNDYFRRRYQPTVSLLCLAPHRPPQWLPLNVIKRPVETVMKAEGPRAAFICRSSVFCVMSSEKPRNKSTFIWPR